MPRVTTEIEGHIAHVTLNRPDKMNAIDPRDGRGDCRRGSCAAEADIRAVVLSGEGRAFCAGLDVMSFAALAQGDPRRWCCRARMVMPTSFRRWRWSGTGCRCR